MLCNRQFPCNTDVDVSLTFGGQSWAISPVDFNLGRVDSNGNCLGGIFSLEAQSSSSSRGSGPASPEWIVGDTFLKNVYSVFRYQDPRAVGFAELSQTARDLDDAPRSDAGLTNASAQVAFSRAGCRHTMATWSIAVVTLLAACLA